MSVHWTLRALEEMRDVVSLITANAYPEDAARWVDGLQVLTNTLADFSESGCLSRVPSLAHRRIRELVYGKYRVFYVIVNEVCEIISLRHCAMNIESSEDL